MTKESWNKSEPPMSKFICISTIILNFPWGIIENWFTVKSHRRKRYWPIITLSLKIWISLNPEGKLRLRREMWRRGAKGRLGLAAIRSQKASFMHFSPLRVGRILDQFARLWRVLSKEVSKVDRNPAKKGYLCVRNQWQSHTQFLKNTARQQTPMRCAKMNTGG